MNVQNPSLPQEGTLVGGRFRIAEELGSGGFGTVYRAVQENVGRDVALKVLAPKIAKDPVNVERFRREAYHVSQLRHPNTITLYDYGQTEDGLFYMVMELLEGTSLSDTIQGEGGLYWPRAAHVFIQVLKSLSEAHQRGLVHRDLKPENIFLCELFGEQDYVKVLDFGVAKMTYDVGGDEEEEALTKAGRIFGTPMYMAPEQACAEEITPATDIYALGLLLFEMFTGKPPVTGRNRMDVIHKQIRDPVPVLEGSELEDTALGEVIRRATKKDPEARYVDAGEMLEPFLRAMRAMKIVPLPAGATSPEISVSSLLPDLPEDADEVVADGDATAERPLTEPDEDPDAVITREALPAQGEAAGSAPPGGPPPIPVDAQRQKAAAQQAQPQQVPPQQAPPQQQAPPPGGRRAAMMTELPLIGREEEMGRLLDLIEHTSQSGHGHIALFEGESGVGKTRVLQTLRDPLSSMGIDIAIGHFRRRATGLEALREALLDYWDVDQGERMQVDKTVRQDLRELGDFEDSEIDFVVELLRPRGVRYASVPEDVDRAGAFFAQLERLLLRLSRRRPLVLVLEDVQHADSATLAFLEYLAVTLNTQRARITVLLSLRSEERHTNPELEGSLRTMSANIGTGLSRLRLRRLKGQQLSRLLDAILPLEPRLKERLAWLSQGNPMHTIQIIRYLQHEDKLVPVRGRWRLREGSPREINLPPDLIDLMQLRLDQALERHDDSEQLRTTLDWLAVLGIRVPVALLTRILADEGVARSEVESSLRLLGEEGIIRQSPQQGMLSVEFDNSLLRETLLAEIADRFDAQRLHRAAAEHKISFYRDNDLEVPLLEVADHWRQASETRRYRDTLLEAAQRSRRRYDLRGARDQFRELLDLLEERDERGEVWNIAILALAELAWRFGEFGLAEDYYRRAIEADTAAGEERSRSMRGLAHLLFLQARHDEAAEHYRQALEASEARDDRAGIAKALIGLSRVHLRQGDTAAGEELRERLEAMRDELPAGEIAGKVYQHLAEVALRRGQLKTQHDYLIRARGEFEESGDRQGLSDVLLELSGALMTPAPDAPSRLEEAADLLRRAQDLKRAIGDRTGVAQTFYRLGTLEIMRDHLDAAEGYLVQGLRMYQALRAQYYVAACHNAIGITKILKREFAEAEKHLKESSNLFDKMGDQIALSHTRLNEGCLEINRQDFTRAQTLLREARRLKESLGTTWALFDLRNHLTIVSLWLGDLDEARRMLETTLERVDTDGTLEDRAIAHSLRGLLQCFQSRLQIGALELQRGRADAEDLGLARVAAFCQANAAFYALLTEDEAGFENLFASFAEVDVLYTVDRAVWLELLERLALHIADREKSRQTVRLVRTAAKFWRAFNHDEQADALDERADEMRAQLEAKSADEEDDEAEDAEAGDEDSTPEPKATSGSSQTEDAG